MVNLLNEPTGFPHSVVDDLCGFPVNAFRIDCFQGIYGFQGDLLESLTPFLAPQRLFVSFSWRSAAITA
jgi:hypothetical protein